LEDGGLDRVIALHPKLIKLNVVLWCIMVHCMVVHYGALRCIMVHCIMVHCIMVHCIMLHYGALWCIAVRCGALWCIALLTRLGVIVIHIMEMEGSSVVLEGTATNGSSWTPHYHTTPFAIQK
jgi:hypothetical protein